MQHVLTTTLALGVIFFASACDEQQRRVSDSQPPLSSPIESRPVVPPPPSGSGTGATALSWSVPAGWVAETPDTPMRKAQYRVPGKAGDAECIVFYFGPGQGGDALVNAERWASQFTLANGRPGSAGMKIRNRRIGDIDVLSVEIAGTYQGGFPMRPQSAPPKPNQMLLGAVAKGPDANWFFKLTGPEATVAAQRDAFEALIASLEPGAG